MSKDDIAKIIAKRTGLTHQESRAAVEAFGVAVFEALSQQKEVCLPALGRMRVVRRAPRTGMNPRTGEMVRAAPRNAVQFRPSPRLKTAV